MDWVGDMTGMEPIATSPRRSDGIGMARHWKRQGACGTTLIEVLVTIAVTSIGLLGMAGLMAVAVKVNHEAYLSTQANFIAQSLIESMHINPAAVADGRYDGTLTQDSGMEVDCKLRGCSAPERAGFDRAQFNSALRINLPNPTSSIRCDAASARSSPALAYDGTCRLEVGWSERALILGGDNPSRSLVWIFQP